MTCISISSDELKDRVAAANRDAAELGMLLHSHTLEALVASGKVQLVYNPTVSSGEFAGLEFFEKTAEWACRGAIQQLMEAFGKPGHQPTFGVGCFGSIWCDMVLTGFVGTCAYDRKVRIAPYKDPKTGVWDIMLDNTSDNTW